MTKILIHCGHWNIKNNCNSALRSGTGAPGEAEFTKQVGIKLEKLLQESGYSTYLDDANTNCHENVTEQDWDLAFAIHADANIYGTGGGFVDVPLPDLDLAHSESQRIMEAIESEYFTESGIVNTPKRRNKNTNQYYLWSALSAKTPCVILECGVLLEAHDSVILNDINRVARAILKGIQKAFPIVVTPPVIDYGAEINKLRNRVAELEKELFNKQKELESKLAECKSICQKEKQILLDKVIEIFKSSLL